MYELHRGMPTHLDTGLKLSLQLSHRVHPRIDIYLRIVMA